MPGADRLVRVGVDAERDPHERAPDAGGGREGGFVGRVEHDQGPFGCSFGEEGVVLVVSVYDELAAGEAGRAREGELARRRNVGAQALLAQQAQQRHVGERLRPVRDEAAPRAPL